MSAETLRRAAALMRERAEEATEGPWRTYRDPHDIVFDQYGTGVQSAATEDVIVYSGQVYSRDAEHIASWHPAVALAVADLLDDLAETLDLGLPFDMRVHIATQKALSVALRYLGENESVRPDGADQ